MTSGKLLQIGVLALFAIAVTSGAEAADRCGALKDFAVAGLPMKITKADMVPAGPLPPLPFGPTPAMTLPSHCEVEGTINERIGAGGRSYAIGFALALPDDWNNRFLFQGGGGLNGFLWPPVGDVAADETPALMRGFAVASTDSGHKSQNGLFDASFFADQQAAIDFEYASIGTVTKLAKAIVAEYYGKPAAYSYFTGCSMGGREGMVAAERYPLEFDGVVSGAPAMHVGFSGIGARWASATLATLAPKGPDGKRDLAKEFTDADRKLFVDGLLKACDGLDGVKDGMIFALAQCRFDPVTLVCKGKKTDTCLSAKQATAIRRAFAGPKDRAGTQIYPAFFYDTGATAGGEAAGFLNPTPNPMGPDVYADKIDVEAEEAKAAGDPIAAVGDTANWTNLSSFFGHGGKLVFFHGASDPWFSAKDTLGYYTRMADANGGMANVRANSSRLFLVPGMSHCSGGPAALDKFDLLTAVTDWVESGKAPDSVVAKGKAFPGRTRPLCAYPAYAHYKGAGNPEDAANFECKL